MIQSSRRKIPLYTKHAHKRLSLFKQNKSFLSSANNEKRSSSYVTQKHWSVHVSVLNFVNRTNVKFKLISLADYTRNLDNTLWRRLLSLHTTTQCSYSPTGHSGTKISTEIIFIIYRLHKLDQILQRRKQGRKNKCRGTETLRDDYSLTACFISPYSLQS